MTPLMTPATEQVFSRTVESEIPDWANAGEAPGLDACLARLTALARK